VELSKSPTFCAYRSVPVGTHTQLMAVVAKRAETRVKLAIACDTMSDSQDALDKETFVRYNIAKLASLNIYQRGYDDNEKHQFNPGSEQLRPSLG